MDDFSTIEQWYRSRQAAVAEREYWGPKLIVLESLAYAFFKSATFPADPVTESPVFTVMIAPMGGFYKNATQIVALTGPILTMGVPIASQYLTLRITNASFGPDAICDNAGFASELRDNRLDLDKSEFVFPTGTATTMPRQICQVFARFAALALKGR